MSTGRRRVQGWALDVAVATWCECSEAPTWRGFACSPRFTYLHARVLQAYYRRKVQQSTRELRGRRETRPAFKCFLLRRLRISGYVIGTESAWMFPANESQRCISRCSTFYFVGAKGQFSFRLLLKRMHPVIITTSPHEFPSGITWSAIMGAEHNSISAIPSTQFHLATRKRQSDPRFSSYLREIIMRPGEAVRRDSRNLIAFILIYITRSFITFEQKQTLGNLKLIINLDFFIREHLEIPATTRNPWKTKD